MAQITCEAAADTPSSWRVICVRMFVCVQHDTTASTACTHVFLLHLCMHEEQTTICDILLWVEPRMTTDLYIGTLRRPVTMAPRVADAERGWRLESERSHLDNRGDAEFQLSDRFSPCCSKKQESPSVTRRCWKIPRLWQFPDSSNEMPAGVLSYIHHVYTKLPLLLPLLAKDRISHQIFSSSHGGKHSSLHDCCWFSSRK